MDILTWLGFVVIAMHPKSCIWFRQVLFCFELLVGIRELGITLMCLPHRSAAAGTPSFTVLCFEACSGCFVQAKGGLTAFSACAVYGHSFLLGAAVVVSSPLFCSLAHCPSAELI